MSTSSSTEARKRKMRGKVERGLRKNTPHAPAASKTSLNTRDTSRPLHSAPQESSCCRWWALTPPPANSGKNPTTRKTLAVSKIYFGLLLQHVSKSWKLGIDWKLFTYLAITEDFWNPLYKTWVFALSISGLQGCH